MPRPAKDTRRLPRGQGITVAAIFVALAGAVLTFVPVISWASFTARAYPLANQDSGRTPTQTELQGVIDGGYLERIELVSYFGFDYAAGIVAGIAFLALPLLLIATIGVQRGAILRSLAIFVFGSAVIIAALCYREEARTSRNISSNVSYRSRGEVMTPGEGRALRGQSHGSMSWGDPWRGACRRSVPAVSERGQPVVLPRSDKVPVVYSAGRPEVRAGVSPPSRAYGVAPGKNLPGR